VGLLEPASQSSPDFLCTASHADLRDARHYSTCCFPVPVLSVLLLQLTVSSPGTIINQTRHDLSFCLRTPTFTTTFCLLACAPRTCFKNSLCPIEPFRSTVDPCLATRHASAKADPSQPSQISPSPAARSLTRLSCNLVVCSTSCPCRLHHFVSRQPSPIVTSAIDIATTTPYSTSTSHPPSLVTCLYTDLLVTNTFISYLIDYPIIPNTAETSQAPSDAHCLTRQNTLTPVALVTHNNRSFARLPRPPPSSPLTTP
jgi:hypothetical protein